MARLNPIPFASIPVFMDRVRVVPGGCWTWEGARISAGYGELWNGKRSVYAHRTAWELFWGPIPDGLCVLHHCDNPPCVNPEHLFLGTKGDNARDCAAKGRIRGGMPKGEAAPHSKLTEAQVLEIRRSDETSGRIAPRYGVCSSAIRKIRNRKNWRHL